MVQSQLGARGMVPTLGVGEKRFLAPRNPPHRAAELACRPDDDRLLRVVLALVAEAAAHILRHDAQAAFVDAELLADVAADMVRRLRAAVERVAGGNAAARLDRRAAEPVIHQLEPHPAGGSRHRGFDSGALATAPFEAVLAIDRRQRLVVHLDLLGRVFRQCPRIGQHGGDRLADVAHRAARKREP